MRFVAGILTLALLGGCGSSPPPPEPGVEENPTGFGYTLSASAGTYSDGTGGIVLAMIVAVRDAEGRGPAEPWTVSLRDGSTPVGETATYSDSSVGSHAVFFWSHVSYEAGRRFWVRVEDPSGKSLEKALVLPDPDNLAVPDLSLDAAQMALHWSNVGASYLCEVTQDGAVQHLEEGTEPSCDVSSLPTGAYLARVRAFSVDLAPLRQETTATAALPARFDVSEAYLGFTAGDTGAGTTMRAVGGSIRWNTDLFSLAVWVSILDANGNPPTEPVWMEVRGPGIDSRDPLTHLYPAGAARDLFWVYDLDFYDGNYTLTAELPQSTVITRFVVGNPEPLDLPINAQMSASASGAGTATVTPVPRAKAYLFSVYRYTGGALHASQWASGPEASFPAGTFVSGTKYSLYVSATDADQLGTAIPTEVSVSENSYNPVVFTAP